MRVLLVHNFYLEPGGEDHAYAAEGDMLERCGHEVVRHSVRNTPVSGLGSARLAAAAVWNGASHAAIGALVRRHRPDVVHFHNTFPLVSPAAYYAAHAEGVPVVQTLHNYRLVCPNALLFRDGAPCEDCLGRAVPWPGVVHRCYRGSRAASASVAAMLTIHRAAHSWRRRVDVFVALTTFARQKLIEGGLPAGAIVIKPNVVHRDPGPGTGRGGYALFVGRLSAEKGIATLLAAWDRDHGPGLPLRIVGGGPNAADVAAVCARRPSVTWQGRLDPADVERAMADAVCVVVPSECYETFGRVIVEAYAVGTPVIAARHGAIGELVKHGGTGLHFAPGDAADLVAQVDFLVTDPSRAAAMRRAARAEFEAKYTVEQNHAMLIEIYRRAARARAAVA